MKKSLVAVIDDGYESRKDIYSDILSEHFEIESYSKEATFVREGKNKHYDLLVIDNILKGWKTNTLTSFLKKYTDLTQCGTPIVAVSQHWHDEQGQSLWDISDVIRKYPIIMIVTWEDFGHFPSGTELSVKWKESIKENIYLKYLWHCGLQPAIPIDEDVVILQLSDTQFGAEADAGAYAVKTEIVSHLRNKSIRPSIVAFCGDISQSGKTHEFEQAEKWIRDFSETFKPKISVNQFVFTVGNHDCNFDSFAPFKYQFDFDKKKFVGNNGKIDWEMGDNKYLTTEELIFSNYLLFEKQCSPDSGSAVYRTNKLNTVDDSFVNWGIRIIALNTVSNISPENISGIGVDVDELEKIINYCLVEHRHEDIYTILITHYSPTDLGYDSGDNEKQEKWEAIIPFLTQLKVKLWLCGHSHKSSKREIELEGGLRIEYSKSSSLRLSRNHLAPNSKRGYNTITLRRKNGIVVEAEIDIHNIN